MENNNIRPSGGFCKDLDLILETFRHGPLFLFEVKFYKTFEGLEPVETYLTMGQDRVLEELHCEAEAIRNRWQSFSVNNLGKCNDRGELIIEDHVCDGCGKSFDGQFKYCPYCGKKAK